MVTKKVMVSVTPEMYEKIKEFNLSPTQIFRVGLGIALLERGVQTYASPLNRERLLLNFTNKAEKNLSELSNTIQLIKETQEDAKR